MIRFIDLKEQITDDFEFAWYDTILDRFLEFSGSQTWDSWNEFERDFGPTENIQRFKNLFPKDKFKVTELT